MVHNDNHSSRTCKGRAAVCLPEAVSVRGHIYGTCPTCVSDHLPMRWAHANVDVLNYIHEARQRSDDLALERGLKWYLTLHDVLLRGPRNARGTRGGGVSIVHTVLGARFAQWEKGELRDLVVTWYVTATIAVSNSKIGHESTTTAQNRPSGWNVSCNSSTMASYREHLSFYTRWA